MRRFALLVALVSLAGATLTPAARPAAPAAAQDDATRTALRSGRYDEVVSALEAEVRAGRAGAGQARMLAAALLELGRHDEAEAAARRWADSNAGSGELANSLGEALRHQGRLAEAEAAFRASIATAAADALQAQLNLAVLEYDTGRRDAAMARFDSFIDVYNGGRRLGSEELTAVGIACTYLGLRDPQLFHDAVRAFDEAIAADPGNLEPRLRLGELFLAKYDSGEAGTLIDDVLAENPSHPRALLAQARRLQFDGEPEALETAGRALEVNPDLVGARAFVGQLLLMSERIDEAAEEALAALRTDPTSPDALAVLAAARYLQDDEDAFEETVARALAISPAQGDLFATVAELAVQNRLYAEAVTLAARGVALDPESWAAHGTLGINQLRIGQIEEGRTSLERAFAGDPFNVWYKNTLDLLDTLDEYETVATDNFELVIERDHAEALGTYMAPLAEEALAQLVERYGFRPQPPIRVEAYRRHADFSVRTVGLAGLSALGVAFGPVVSVVSPASADMGEFNWGSTLWHEITHVITLGATDNRIPRWLTEGLSVVEERRARPGWGEEATPSFLLAYLGEQLLPVSEINEGFVRPRYPEHVVHSYMQASLVCEFIERDWGFAAMRGMLAGYRDGQSTPEIVRAVLGIEPEQLDERFVQYFEERYAVPLEALRPALQADNPAMHQLQEMIGAAEVQRADLERRANDNPGDFVAQISMGNALAAEGRVDEAAVHLERARGLFPEYSGLDSPYLGLARIYEQQGRTSQAIDMLTAFVERNESHLPAYEKLGELLRDAGRAPEAADVLARAPYIDPLQIDAHRRLAGLLGELGDWEGAALERRAVVALRPVDRADALYQLAVAYHRAGDPRAARRAVLGALEIAPGFQAAQALLLEIRASRESS